MEQEPLMPEVLSAERTSANAPNNGNGRPRGARNLKHRALERAARAEALPILLQLIKQARDGDTIAAKIILDRIWPRPRMAPISINLPETRTPAELRQAMHGLLAQVATGQIPPDAGAALVQIMRDVLDSHRVQAFAGDEHSASEESGTRDMLLARLQKAIAERERAQLPAAEPQSP
jgi:hypothetical protein